MALDRGAFVRRLETRERQGPGSRSPEIPPVEQPARPSADRFSWWIVLIGATAFVLRLMIVYQARHDWLSGDGFLYSIEANNNARGKWFADAFSGQPDALHPPAWTTLLTVWAWLGQRSWLSQQVLASAVGGLTVVVVGLAGRRIAGARVGLMAAGIAAVYPGLWVYERALLSETLLLLGVALLILLTYRFWASPSPALAAVLGFVCGLVASTRSEQILALFFVITPLILTVKNVNWRRRVGWLALAYLATAIVLTPWTLYNSGRFQHPVLLSNNFGSAVAQGNCDSTYNGPAIGEYSFSCFPATNVGNQSAANSEDLHSGLNYMEHHLNRLPLVLFAREGRGFGFWNPFQQIDLDASWLGSGPGQQAYMPTAVWILRLALFGFWLLLLSAVAGIVELRRRRIPVYPLLAFFAIAILTIAATYGESRLRAGVEIPLVLLASVGIVGIGTSVQHRRPLGDEVLVGAESNAAPPYGGGGGQTGTMRVPRMADRIRIRAVAVIALVLSLIAAGVVLHSADTAAGGPLERMVKPSNGASLTGRATLAATAQAGVTRVEFRATGGALRDTVVATGIANAFGWVAYWNTSNARPGRYHLWCVAYKGSSGNPSSEITVTVNAG